MDYVKEKLESELTVALSDSQKADNQIEHLNKEIAYIQKNKDRSDETADQVLTSMEKLGYDVSKYRNSVNITRKLEPLLLVESTKKKSRSV